MSQRYELLRSGVRSYINFDLMELRCRNTHATIPFDPKYLERVEQRVTRNRRSYSDHLHEY